MSTDAPGRVSRTGGGSGQGGRRPWCPGCPQTLLIGSPREISAASCPPPLQGPVSSGHHTALAMTSALPEEGASMLPRVPAVPPICTRPPVFTSHRTTWGVIPASLAQPMRSSVMPQPPLGPMSQHPQTVMGDALSGQFRSSHTACHSMPLPASVPLSSPCRAQVSSLPLRPVHRWVLSALLLDAS